MRKQNLAVVLFVVVTLRASAAAAQACLGLPSFANASVHINAAGEFPDSATAFAVGVGGGRDRAMFGNLGAGQVTYEGLDAKSTFGFLELGYHVPLGRFQLCPIAGGYIGSGPNDDDIGLTHTQYGASGGLAAGMPIGTRFLTLIPNVAIKYDFAAVTAEQVEFEAVTEHFNNGVVDLGLGIVFRDRFSIQPLLHIPFGGVDDKTSFGVFAAVRFSWKDW